MQSLEIAHFSDCIEHGQDGLLELTDALMTCKDTLRVVDISLNNWNKNQDAVQGVQDMIIACSLVQQLDISSLGLGKPECA